MFWLIDLASAGFLLEMLVVALVSDDNSLHCSLIFTNQIFRAVCLVCMEMHSISEAFVREIQSDTEFLTVLVVGCP